MKKAITVRKNSAQRAGLWTMLFLMICVSAIICLICAPIPLVILLFCALTLPVLFLCLYYETWKIHFGVKKLTIKQLFRRTKTYSFNQISDAYVDYSYTLREFVHIAFWDGTSIVFRMEDENANLAKRRINASRSLRILNYKTKE